MTDTGEAPEPIRIPVDAAGLPILDQPARPPEAPKRTAPAAGAVTLPPDVLQTLRGQLGAELEERLQHMVQEAFCESVKLVALDLKHTFEQQLNDLLAERLPQIVAHALDHTAPPSEDA